MIIKEYFDLEYMAAKPKEKLTGAEWAENYRVLTSVTSNLPGFWRNDAMYITKDVLNAITSDNVQEVSWCSGTQNGKTETMLNALGYFITQSPAPIMLVYPEKDDAKVTSKVRLADMIENARDNILKQRVELSDKKQDIFNIPFIGGIIYMAWATSVNKLASRPARYVFLDEIDKYKELKGHGRPLDLAKERRKAFPNSKIVAISTPVYEEGGIWQAVSESDYVFNFYSPCPKCNKEFLWSIENLSETDGFIYYRCPYCDYHIASKEKLSILSKSSWKTEDGSSVYDIISAGYKLKLGFKSNSFVSNFISLEDIYREYERAKQTPEALKVFINGWLGLPYTEDNLTGSDFDIEALLARCEDYAELPIDVLCLTCGVDIQKDRIEYIVVGWGLARENWLVDKGVIVGDTMQELVWEELNYLLLEKRYKHSAGIDLKIYATCIDSGYNTSKVYEFCKLRERFRIFAIKGANRSDAPEVGAPKKSGLIKATRFDLGVHSIKNNIYYWLSLQEAGAGYMHFKAGLCDRFLWSS